VVTKDSSGKNSEESVSADSSASELQQEWDKLIASEMYLHGLREQLTQNKIADMRGKLNQHEQQALPLLEEQVTELAKAIKSKKAELGPKIFAEREQRLQQAFGKGSVKKDWTPADFLKEEPIEKTDEIRQSLPEALQKLKAGFKDFKKRFAQVKEVAAKSNAEASAENDESANKPENKHSR